MEIGFTARECIACGACATICERQAIYPELTGRINLERCDLCGKCVDVCPGGGLRRIGTYYSLDSLVEILMRDAPYFHHSGGGVTLSGGEPTLFPNYIESLARTLHNAGIHVAIQTCGHFDFAMFETQVLPYVDLVYYDIKIIDSEIHRMHTGSSNHRILSNFRRLVRKGNKKIRPRVPLVPGITDTRENLSAIVTFLRAVGAPEVSFLPYNPLGLDKYLMLGKRCPNLAQRHMRSEEEGEVFRILEAAGLSTQMD